MPQLSDRPYLHPNASLTDVTLGRYVEIGEGTRIVDSILGDYSYTDRYADIAYARIGKFANIAAMVRINPSEHPYWRASLHHFIYRAGYYWEDEPDESYIFDWRKSRQVIIGNDTWIGHAAIVMKGVTIGDGAVVGSHAVVTKDVPPYAIVTGAPAKFLKWRHSAGTAERLRKLAWWDWDHGRLRAALPDFRAFSAEGFLDKYEARGAAGPAALAAASERTPDERPAA